MKLMDLAADKKISKVIIEHKDRLIRFNYNILYKYFKRHDVEV
jgi:predicted site-specific integrase-resolvase